MSCLWQRIRSTSNTMDIKPYDDLVKPFYHLENIEIKHPEDRPRGKFTSRGYFNAQKEVKSSIILQGSPLYKP